MPREALAEERSGEREVLLKGRLWAALLRLNDWLTEEQAEWAIFEQSNVNEVGIALNQRIHEYMTFGLPLTVNTRRGPTPGAGRIPATSASSTSITPKACSTSSSSPPGSGCGEATILYEVQRSHRRRKTAQITMDSGRVIVAAPVETTDSKLEAVVHRIAPWILRQSPDGHHGTPEEALRQRGNAAVPGPRRPLDRPTHTCTLARGPV